MDVSRHLLFVVVCAALTACGSDSDSDYRYVAMGASDAVGIGATPPDNGYVFIIEDALDECRSEGAALINLGIPGAELPTVEDVQVPLVQEAEPNLITLWPGPNDLVAGRSAENFESRLEEIIADLVGTGAFVVIANIPDLRQLPTFQDEPDPDVTAARIQAYNVAIARQAASYGVPVVNLASLPMSDDLVFGADGFHPNDQGYQIIAQAFLDVIRPSQCP